MIRLRVVRESFGWSVQLDNHTTSPFRSRNAAITAAHRIAADISRHGERAEVTVEDDAPEGRRQGGASAGRPQASDGRWKE
jgi:hypothetical protein